SGRCSAQCCSTSVKLVRGGGWTPSKICKATVVRYPVGSRFGYISDGRIPVDRRDERKPVVVAVKKCKIFGVKTVPFSRKVWFISATKLAQK
ncbi:MAG: hypothetical protein VYB72_07955, partial [Planctomycetota bacterium]|nr:hypothetical protein [Planctomycetota bacterium]